MKGNAHGYPLLGRAIQLIVVSPPQFDRQHRVLRWYRLLDLVQHSRESGLAFQFLLVPF